MRLADARSAEAMDVKIRDDPDENGRGAPSPG
jgi:hypothetical protein